jgi:hypothetical protein
VVIDTREPQIFEGGLAQILKEALLGSLRRKGACPDVLYQEPQLETIHRSKLLLFVDFRAS